MRKIDKQLLDAITSRDTAAVEATLHMGANPNTRFEYVGYVQDHNIDADEFVVAAGYPATRYVDRSENALAYCAERGMLKIIKLLIQYGANHNLDPGRGFPAEIARKNKRKKTVKFLENIPSAKYGEEAPLKTGQTIKFRHFVLTLKDFEEVAKKGGESRVEFNLTIANTKRKLDYRYGFGSGQKPLNFNKRQYYIRIFQCEKPKHRCKVLIWTQKQRDAGLMVRPQD